MVRENARVKKTVSSLSSFISEQWLNYRKHFCKNPNSNEGKIWKGDELCQEIFAETTSNCSQTSLHQKKDTYTKNSRHTYVVSSAHSSNMDSSSSDEKKIGKTGNLYNDQPMLNTSSTYYCDCTLDKKKEKCCPKIKLQVRKTAKKENSSQSCNLGCQCACAFDGPDVKCKHKDCPHSKKKKKKCCNCCSKASFSSGKTSCSCDSRTKVKGKCSKSELKRLEKQRKKEEKECKKALKKKKSKTSGCKSCKCLPPCLDGSATLSQCCNKGDGKCYCKSCKKKKRCKKTESKCCCNSKKGKVALGSSKTNVENYNAQVCQSPGGAKNSNTLVYPKDDKDTLDSVRMMIKMESRQNYRNINNILNELKKQRKDIEELKKMCVRTHSNSDKRKNSKGNNMYTTCGYAYGIGNPTAPKHPKNVLEGEQPEMKRNSSPNKVADQENRSHRLADQENQPRTQENYRNFRVMEPEKKPHKHESSPERSDRAPPKLGFNDDKNTRTPSPEKMPQTKGMPSNYTKYLVKNIEKSDDGRKSEVYTFNNWSSQPKKPEAKKRHFWGKKK
ncbi:unnamed protein product [Brassicogethes aeneus]|uniref:Uncharacterized protein n=1 Tax=Brassicogethes aeneus TaxID=1431903 RepID=A0A9P0B666_BRAAE|nr:unnamed protein product [Brassicogethes aeneus]